MPSFLIPGYPPFPTKSAARAKVKELLNSQPLGKPFVGEEKALLLGLLVRYPKYRLHDEYVNAQNIVVLINQQYGNRSFHADDGTNPPLAFSYIKAFTKPTLKRRINAALRSLIVDQVRAYKDSCVLPSGKIKCAVSGELLEPHEVDVDHDYDSPDLWFSVIASRWLDEQETKAPAIDNVKRSRVIKFVDERLNDSWRKHHAEHCRLRCVRRDLNQGHGTPTSSDASSDDEKIAVHNSGQQSEDPTLRPSPTQRRKKSSTPTPSPSPAMPPAEESEIDISKLSLSDIASCRDCGDELSKTYASAGMTQCRDFFSRWIESL